jgi:hypothetical protein
MSGFKQNTRFSSLISNEGSNKETKKENEKNKVTNNIETKKHGIDNSFKKTNNKYYSDDRLKDDRKREAERKIKEEQIKLVLTVENFPELAPKPGQNISTPNASINYASLSEKLTTSVVENKVTSNVDIDYKNLLPGWSIIKKDIDKNNITIKTKPLKGPILEKNNDNNFKLLDALVELHENRTSEYIENWDYDEWEKMFKFPNYDYNYFDKLDELYYTEMESEFSEGDEDDYNDMVFMANNEYDDY